MPRGRGAMERYSVGAFTRASSHVLAEAAATGGPIAVDNRNQPYVAVVSDGRLRQYQEAEQLVHGLLRLSRRGASYKDFAAFADMLDELVKLGKLNIHELDERPSNAA